MKGDWKKEVVETLLGAGCIALFFGILLEAVYIAYPG